MQQSQKVVVPHRLKGGMLCGYQCNDPLKTGLQMLTL